MRVSFSLQFPCVLQCALFSRHFFLISNASFLIIITAKIIFQHSKLEFLSSTLNFPTKAYCILTFQLSKKQLQSFYCRHVITAPSLHDVYGNTAFPGITDALFDIDFDPDQVGRWNEVKRQYSIVIFHILSAAATLGPVV